VAAIEGAAGALPAPPAAVLPLLTLGALVLLLWRGRARWAGAAVAVAALGLWAGAERPALLITASGGTIGVIGPEGRAISRPTGDAFAVAAWLENDGDLAPQAAAADRPGGGFHAVVAGLEIRLVRGERALAALAGCGGADILVADHPAGPRPCLVLDPPRLAGTGAVALHLDAAGPRLVTVAQRSGDRLWTRSAASDPAPLELP
jgi:competence protein ComEC